jgi:hypothetical protein
MEARLNNGRMGEERCIAFKRILLPIVYKVIKNKGAKASESRPECFSGSGRE